MILVDSDWPHRDRRELVGYSHTPVAHRRAAREAGALMVPARQAQLAAGAVDLPVVRDTLSSRAVWCRSRGLLYPDGPRGYPQNFPTAAHHPPRQIVGGRYT